MQLQQKKLNMLNNPVTQTIDLGEGKVITLETGKLAKQSDGSVLVRMGKTMMLATICAKTDAKDDVDFLPLSVDYQEKFASNGRIPGGFLKREGRLSDYEVLISRLVDRAMRPLFPEDFHADTQILVYLISHDENVMPDSLAALAASAATSISDIPFNGPIAEVRVARIDGKFIVNPTAEEMKTADLDLMVSASAKDINMVEGEMKEVSEEVMVEALRIAHDAIKKLCAAQIEFAAKLGKAKREYSHEKNNEDLKKQIYDACYEKAFNIAKQGNPNKKERKAAFDAVKTEFVATLDAEFAEENAFLISKYYHETEWHAVRNAVLETRVRLDGRKLDQIRPIECEVDFLPSPHGSALFTRGETQSLTSVTLGSKLDEQLIDGAVIAGTNRFMLHYNFPPFSTGEVKPMRGTGRREVGHGNLALRGLKQVMPADCPYTVRIVSDILESNGSSSMATVCAGSLALMDAGIKTAKPVAGIAMGLITDATGKYAILSDILGDEDHLGDMDFKVVGTENGITACQMDIKVDGLSYEVLTEALMQAKQGRLHILGEMSKALQQPREDYKPHAPRIVVIEIAKEFIGAVIGPGGKIIQDIQKTSGTVITIEEVGEIGRVEISSPNKASIDIAVARVKAIVAVPEIGAVYEGKVKNIQSFGAFVEFMPGKDGLLHISEISYKRLETMDGVLKEGDIVKVKLMEVDKKTGKFKLSAKALLPKPERAPAANNTAKTEEN
jgi:polyribonucleotide nucleotidyltransferase